jgi:hypothetical protein
VSVIVNACRADSSSGRAASTAADDGGQLCLFLRALSSRCDGETSAVVNHAHAATWRSMISEQEGGFATAEPQRCRRMRIGACGWWSSWGGARNSSFAPISLQRAYRAIARGDERVRGWRSRARSAADGARERCYPDRALEHITLPSSRTASERASESAP